MTKPNFSELSAVLRQLADWVEDFSEEAGNNVPWPAATLPVQPDATFVNVVVRNGGGGGGGYTTPQ